MSFDIIYLFLIFCVFIIVNQNNNIANLNKIISNTAKKNIETGVE